MQEANEKLTKLSLSRPASFNATKCTNISAQGALYVAPNITLPNMGGLLMQVSKVSPLVIATLVNKETFSTIASTWKKNSKTPASLSFNYSQFIRAELGNKFLPMESVFVLISYVGSSRKETKGDRVVKFSYEIVGEDSVSKLESLSGLFKKERDLLSKITASNK